MADSNDIRRNVVEHACSSKNTKNLTAADVAILKNYAVQLRKANIAQEQKIMKQDTKIHSQKQKIKGLKSKLRERDVFIDSERKRLDDQMRVNNEDQKSLYALEKQIKRVEDTYNKTRTLVCKVVPEMFLFALKQKAVEKARAARMFYNVSNGILKTSVSAGGTYCQAPYMPVPHCFKASYD